MRRLCLGGGGGVPVCVCVWVGGGGLGSEQNDHSWIDSYVKSM